MTMNLNHQTNKDSRSVTNLVHLRQHEERVLLVSLLNTLGVTAGLSIKN